MAEETADVAIFVALEDELRAIMKLIPNSVPVDPPLHPWIVYEARVQSQDRKGSVRVVFARSTQPGQRHANTLASVVSSKFRPRFVFACGIAAAAEKKGGHLGDVIVGRSAYYYVPAKISSEDPQYRPRHSEQPCSSLLLNWALGVERHNRNWHETLRTTRPIEPPTEQRQTYGYPKVIEGVVASGEYLIRSEEFMNWLVDNVNDYICAAEMESASFCHASIEASGADIPHVIIIRAVTDYGDRSKSDEWREYGCEASALYALELIEKWVAPHVTGFPSHRLVEKDPLLVEMWAEQHAMASHIGVLGLRVRNVSDKPVRIESLELETTGQWDIPDPGRWATLQPITLPERFLKWLVQVRRTPGSTAHRVLGTEIDPGKEQIFEFIVVTDHRPPFAYGVFPFLLLPKLKIQKGRTLQLRPVLLSLNPSYASVTLGGSPAELLLHYPTLHDAIVTLQGMANEALSLAGEDVVAPPEVIDLMKMVALGSFARED